METWTKKTTVKRERGIEHLYRTIDDPLIPIPARVISRPNRGSYSNRVGDTSHKWDRLTVNARIYIYIYRSPVGLRRAFSFSGARSLEKQTVKARWSLIKLAPLSGRSPLIRVDPGAAHRKGPGRVLGPAWLNYTRGQAGTYPSSAARVRCWQCGINAFDTCHRIATPTYTLAAEHAARPAARIHISRALGMSEDVNAAIS